MPTYEYECLACKKRFERFQKFSDPPVTECPECAGQVRKVLFPAGIVFKGSGWYVTDSRPSSSDSGSSASGSAAAASGASETKTETKSETKTETKSESASSASASNGNASTPSKSSGTTPSTPAKA